MKLHLYKLSFYRSTEDIASDYEYLTEIDKESVANINVVASFDYEDEHDNYTCWILTNLEEFQIYKRILDRNFIHHTARDFSKEVITNKFNLEDSLLKYHDTFNVHYFIEFTFKVNNWIKENLELDMILDMINEKGVDALRPIDLDFLKKV